MFFQDKDDFIKTAESSGFSLPVIDGVLSLFGGYESFTEFSESISLQVFLTSLAQIEPSKMTEDDYPRDSTTIINTVIDDTDIEKEDLYRFYDNYASDIREAIIGNNRFAGFKAKEHMDRIAAYIPQKAQSLFLCGIYDMDIEPDPDNSYSDYSLDDLKVAVSYYLVYLLCYEYLRQIGGLDSSRILDLDLSQVGYVTCESAQAYIDSKPSNKDCGFSFGPENSSMHDALELHSIDFNYDENTIDTKNPVITGIIITKRHKDEREWVYPEIIKITGKSIDEFFIYGDSLVSVDVKTKKDSFFGVFMSDKSVASMNVDVRNIDVNINDDSVLTLSGKANDNAGNDRYIRGNSTLIATNLTSEKGLHWYLEDSATALFSTPEMHITTYLRDNKTVRYLNSNAEEVPYPYRGLTTEQIIAEKAKK